MTVAPSIITYIDDPTHLLRTSTPVAEAAAKLARAGYGAATSRQTTSGEPVRDRDETTHVNTHADDAADQVPRKGSRKRKAAKVIEADHAHADGLHKHKAWHTRYNPLMLPVPHTDNAS